jgi:predicted metal-dependent enzyme (double-stranded beta helix superfamily)
VFRRLIEDLRARAPGERENREVGSLLASSLGEWSRAEPLISRPGGYTRTCAYRDPRFEVLVLNWAPGAASAIHDHGDQDCWMLVLDGRLEVEDYARLDPGNVPGYALVEPRSASVLGPGDVDLRSGRFDLHRVVATGGSRAVTLHVYSGPLRQFLIYDERAQRCERAQGVYDQVLSA